MRSYGGETSHIWLRRLCCKRCGRLHLELPDLLVPQKHYAAEVIENVVDEVSTEEDESTEDYPCQDTMQRWKRWMAFCETQIEGGSDPLETGSLAWAVTFWKRVIPCSRPSAWTGLVGWGSVCERFTTQVAACPLPPMHLLCMVSRKSHDVYCLCKEVWHHGQPRKNDLAR